MSSRQSAFRCSLAFVGAAFLVGCSDPYAGRMEVTGAVNLQGQPLKEGRIMFFPLDKQDTQGGAPIVDGEYQVPRQNGLKAGKYLVRLTAGDGKTMARVRAPDSKHPTQEQAAAPGGSTNIVSMDLIPEDWNIRSKQEVEVKPDQVNRFAFDIPNANTPRNRR